MHLDKLTVSEKLRRHILGRSVSPPSDYTMIPTENDHTTMKSYNKGTSTSFDALLEPFPLRYHKSKDNIRGTKREHSIDLPPDSTTNSLKSKRKRGRPPKKLRKVATIEPETKIIEIITDEDIKVAKVEKFQHFRKRMLQQIYKENEYGLQSNYQDQMEIKSEPESKYAPLVEYKVNQNLYSTSHTTTESIKDEEYIEKRKRNNESAKKSRAKRKMIEDGIVARVAFLENENYELKLELGLVKYQMALLKVELKNQQT